MLNLILKNKPTVLCTESTKIANIIVNIIIEQKKYKYSEYLNEKYTVTTVFDYIKAKEIAPNISNENIVVSTLDSSIWKELRQDVEVWNLDNLGFNKLTFISFLVFSNPKLRKGFSSNFWINALKILSPNFFEIYIFSKIIEDLSKNEEKLNLNKNFFNAFIDYLEEKFSIENTVDIYPRTGEINKFLYFLLDSKNPNNLYKSFNDIDLLDRIYHKYKILYNLPSKNLDTLILDYEDDYIRKIVEVFNRSCGEINFLSCVDNLPSFEGKEIENLDLENLSTIYPFSFVFIFLDKKIIVVEKDKKYFIFEAKNLKISNVEIVKSVFEKFNIQFYNVYFIYYTSQEIYSEFIKMIIKSLRYDVNLSFKILSTPLLAFDYEYYNNLGFVLMLKGDLDEAEKIFFKYLDFDDILINYNIATLYWLKGNYLKSLEIFQQKLEKTQKERMFSVIIPIYPFPKKSLLFDIDGGVLRKISFANLLFLNGYYDDALRALSKVSEDRAKYDENLYKYFLESKNFIVEKVSSKK